jgi:hypothetical protein
MLRLGFFGFMAKSRQSIQRPCFSIVATNGSISPMAN